ncbi:MAG: class I SAM-dependent methyltransferase [Acidimicrobiia bacterium]|nr:class I SAM-dependent methyltransferase [Acidimicrobiia bacterium]
MDDIIRRDHWDDRYRTIGPTNVSWYESEPRLSLAMLELGGLDRHRSVIDLGGGASSLSARLVARGNHDVTVLDVSAEALRITRSSIDDPDAVTFIEADVTEWSPTRTWDLWHDRAVFHFLTGEDQRDNYRAALRRGLAPGGVVCLATFAADGPESCSGLPVRRYRPEELLAELGTAMDEIASGRYLHTTPSGGVQPFSWVVARRRG